MPAAPPTAPLVPEASALILIPPGPSLTPERTESGPDVQLRRLMKPPQGRDTVARYVRWRCLGNGKNSVSNQSDGQ